jgi:hypothetical protein
MFLCSASSIVILVFCFLIGSFPVFYHDLLLLGSEIDRDSSSEGLIELIDIVACDIVLPFGDELPLHDV